MVGDNSQRNNEDTNSEIRQTHFLIQYNKWCSSQEWKKNPVFNGDLGASIAA